MGSATHPLRVEVKAVQVEIDGIEALFVAETMAPNLDRLGPAVESLGRAIADLEHDGIQNATLVLLDGLSRLLDRLQPTAHCP